MTDFPAAHSMDAEWFAVDDDGHVAMFVTGETGAMPSEGRFVTGGGNHDDAQFPGGLPMAALLAARVARPEMYAWFEAHPDWAFDVWLAVLYDPEVLSWLGIYVYQCIGAESPPYVASDTASPLRLESLPEPFRTRMTTARLPVRFEQARRIAVPALVAANAWRWAWRDLDDVQQDLKETPATGFAAVEAGRPAPVVVDEAAAKARLRAFIARSLPEGVSREEMAANVLRWLE